MIATGWLPSLLDWRGMKLADQLNAGPQPKRTACVVRAIYEQLDDDDSKALKTALERIRQTDVSSRSAGTEQFNLKWVFVTLHKAGFRFGYTSLRRHFDGMCSCESL